MKTTPDHFLTTAQVIDELARACAHADAALQIAERVCSGEVLSDDDREMLKQIPRIRAGLVTIGASLGRAAATVRKHA